MRVKHLNHTVTCFLKNSLSLLWEHANLLLSGTSVFKACTEALHCTFHIRQSPAYVCRPLRYRILIAVSTLDRLQYNWADVITHRTPVWASQSPDNSNRPTAAVIRVLRSEISWLYWSAMSLREGLMGAWGSLIKPTLRVTHGAEAAALGHRYEHLFFFCPPARRSPRLPASHMKWRACKWVMSAHNAMLRHPAHSLVSALLSPQSPSSLFIFFTGISQNLDIQSFKPCPAPRAAKTAGKKASAQARVSISLRAIHGFE